MFHNYFRVHQLHDWRAWMTEGKRKKNITFLRKREKNDALLSLRQQRRRRDRKNFRPSHGMRQLQLTGCSGGKYFCHFFISFPSEQPCTWTCVRRIHFFRATSKGIFPFFPARRVRDTDTDSSVFSPFAAWDAIWHAKQSWGGGGGGGGGGDADTKSPISLAYGSRGKTKSPKEFIKMHIGFILYCCFVPKYAGSRLSKHHLVNPNRYTFPSSSSSSSSSSCSSLTRRRRREKVALLLLLSLPGAFLYKK